MSLASAARLRAALAAAATWSAACTNDYDLLGGAGAATDSSAAQGGQGAGAAPSGAGAGGRDAAGGAAGSGSVGGGAPCLPTQLGVERAAAYPSQQGKTIDGGLEDWGCGEPLVLDAASAAFVFPEGGDDVVVAARVRFEWDPEFLYFAAEVLDPTAGQGGHTTEPYFNDSVELYLGGSMRPQADYGVFDHHYIVDHKNLAVEESPPIVTLDDDPAGFESAVLAFVGGYRVEARVEAARLGAPWQVGRTLGMDLLVSDGEGQAVYLVWALAEHGVCGACSGCCCQDDGGAFEKPFCNTLVFGELDLL
jgi:hypothetical protein